MAVLIVIGGVDTNVHLGGLVEHSDYGRGTVASVSTNGKITVQFDNILELKTCRLPDLKVVGFFYCTAFSPSYFVNKYMNTCHMHLHRCMLT
jgi:hypothetical protein